MFTNNARTITEAFRSLRYIIKNAATDDSNEQALKDHLLEEARRTEETLVQSAKDTEFYTLRTIGQSIADALNK